jgi:hypothetical protein
MHDVMWISDPSINCCDFLFFEKKKIKWAPVTSHINCSCTMLVKSMGDALGAFLAQTFGPIGLFFYFCKSNHSLTCGPIAILCVWQWCGEKFCLAFQHFWNNFCHVTSLHDIKKYQMSEFNQEFELHFII